jgi:hypothetical protein
MNEEPAVTNALKMYRLGIETLFKGTNDLDTMITLTVTEIAAIEQHAQHDSLYLRLAAVIHLMHHITSAL